MFKKVKRRFGLFAVALILSQPFLFAVHALQHYHPTHHPSSEHSYVSGDALACQLCSDYFHQVGEVISQFQFVVFCLPIALRPAIQASHTVTVTVDFRTRGPPIPLLLFLVAVCF